MSAAERTVESALKASPFLGLLSVEARARLAAAGSPLALEPGKLLCQQGDPGDAVFVVLEGEIEIRTNSVDGIQVRFASFGPTAVVGEMAVLDGGVRSTDMIAVARSRLWRIPRAPLIAALSAEPQAAVALIAELAGRLRIANASLEAIRTLDLGGRLATLLLESMGPRALVALTQTEVARRLGASREKVNRKLNDWAHRGWVELGPSGIRVLEAESLAELLGAAAQS